MRLGSEGTKADPCRESCRFHQRNKGSQGTEGTAMKAGLTDNQILHRQYLASPGWAAKRQEALSYYGTTCAACGKHGTDVHHKTYIRWGGQELMRDLQVRCRGCHEALHAAHRGAGRRSRKKT